MRFTAIMRNLNVANLVLLAILVLVAGYEFPSFFRAQTVFVPPSPAKSAETEGKNVEVQPSPASEYTAIAEQNIFHPERKIPDIKLEAAPLPKPDFVLYGTLIAGDINLAYMEDRKGTGGAAAKKRQRAIKKGETISGFTLKEIDPEKVVMVRGDEVLEVRVTDKARPTGNGSATAPKVSTAQPAARPAQPTPAQINDIRRRRQALRNAPGSTGGQAQPLPAQPNVAR